MRVVALIIVSVLLGGTQLGCSSSARGLAPPRITVQNILPLEASAGAQRFRVSLLIDNPNPDPLPIKDLEFKLRLADQGILDGHSATPLTVAALDQEILMFDLSSEIVSSLSRLLSFVQGPANTLPYELYGTVTLDRALQNPMSFSVRGQVPLAMTGER
jgi:LEA14-like dessication related protein